MKIKTLIWAFVVGGFLAILPLQVPAQTPTAPVPQFIPSSTWEVSATSLSQLRGMTSVKLPCMMMSRYNNGFIMRLSGGGGNLLAMAIDFRQSIFRQGKKYDAAITLDDSYTERTRATAFSDSVLIFNLRDFSGFYQGIRNAQKIGLDIEGNVMAFALGGVSEGLQRLEACYTGKTPSSTEIQEVSAKPMGQAMGVPQTGNWEEKVTPTVSKAPRGPRGPRELEQTRSVWTAKAGDDLQMTVQQWANKAGVDVAWQADNGGRVVNDISVTGTFEEAVQNLMAQNAAALGIEANMMGGGTSSAAMNPITPSYTNYSSTESAYVSKPLDDNMSYGAPTSITPVSQAYQPDYGNSQYSESNYSASARWNASAGANLEQVLGTWAMAEGVEFIWQANETFAVKHPINANGSFESALQSLLGQFTNDTLRPAAQLNNDPVTGRRILFVESSRVL